MLYAALAAEIADPQTLKTAPTPTNLHSANDVTTLLAATALELPLAVAPPPPLIRLIPEILQREQGSPVPWCLVDSPTIHRMNHIYLGLQQREYCTAR